MGDISISSVVTDQLGRYGIFTANKTGTYLVYGWVKVPNTTEEEIVLEQGREGNTIEIETKQINSEEVFLFCRVMLAENTTVSVRFKSNYTDNSFHVYEL